MNRDAAVGAFGRIRASEMVRKLRIEFSLLTRFVHATAMLPPGIPDSGRDPFDRPRQPQHYFMSDASNPPSKPSAFRQNKELASGKVSVLPFDMAPPTGGWKEDGRLRIQSLSSFAGRELTVRGNGKKLVSTSDVS